MGSIGPRQEDCRFIADSYRTPALMNTVAAQVGVGTSSAKEVVIAVEKASMDARRHAIQFPLTKGYSFPHRVDGLAGAAKVMLRPASEGTGATALSLSF